MLEPLAGAEAVGAEAVGAEAVGAEAVGAEAVGAEEICAYTVGIKHSTNTIKTELARDNNAIPFLFPL